jgi:hypothetical protein
MSASNIMDSTPLCRSEQWYRSRTSKGYSDRDPVSGGGPEGTAGGITAGAGAGTGAETGGRAGGGHQHDLRGADAHPVAFFQRAGFDLLAIDKRPRRGAEVTEGNLVVHRGEDGYLAGSCLVK